MPRSDALSTARFAGILYLTIIVLGLTSELMFRGAVRVPGDAEATVAAIAAQPMQLRFSILADMVMALADVGLAILLFRLLRNLGEGLALAATAFRLVQAAIIGASLPLLMAAISLTESDPLGAAEAFARHGFAYDLGLMFFGVNSILTGMLIARLGAAGRLLGPGLMAAGLVYITGTTLRILSPEMAATFAPAYGLTVLAEGAITIWLLVGGAWRSPRLAHA